MTRLAEDINETLAILARGSEGIDAVMNNKTEANRFSRALEALQRLCEQRSIPIAIVGGLGAIRYGYPAATQDIDIAVSRKELDSFMLAAPQYGFTIAWRSESGWHTLEYGDVEIYVVPEGGKARDTAPTEIPGPREMGVTSGLEYARLESWMELKVSSARQKDRAHMVEVLKKIVDKDSIDAIRNHLASVHPSYETLFEQLLALAQEEKDQERPRR